MQPPIYDGVIDEVIRSLKNSMEASVYLVRAGVHTRKARGTRQARAISKSTRFGRRWKNAEVDALYKLGCPDT